MNSTKRLIGAHQTRDRTVTRKKKSSIAMFDNLDLRKFFVETDSQQYPR